MIGILDYGVGNLRSIQNMLHRIGAPHRLVDSPAAMNDVDRLVLPGVGAFDAGMRRLRASGLLEPILAAVSQGMPLLGICLGMQMLGVASEEGEEGGLGLLPARTVRFRFEGGDPVPKVPHMGWSEVRVRRANPLLDGDRGPHRFYFVHSFHLVCDDEDDIIAEAEHGSSFACAVGRNNVYGVQFHPEKSHRHGMALLEAFARLAP